MIPHHPRLLLDRGHKGSICPQPLQLIRVLDQLQQLQQHPGRTWLEAETVEARLMARLPPADSLRAMDRACTGRLTLRRSEGFS
jgi:hypothetical protein